MKRQTAGKVVRGKKVVAPKPKLDPGIMGGIGALRKKVVGINVKDSVQAKLQVKTIYSDLDALNKVMIQRRKVKGIDKSKFATYDKEITKVISMLSKKIMEY